MAPKPRTQTAREAVATSDVPPEISVAEQSNTARLRQSASNQFGPSNHAASTTSHWSNTPDEPPRFTIDLSLPPEQRYLEVCAAFEPEMLNLTSLFDEVVGGMLPFISTKWLRRICKTFLRKIYNKEENAELKGISKATGVEMYLLVCFNVLLDLFMGCSSGGAVVRSGPDMNSGSKMVHFRTLDWGMPALRRIIVHLDYVAEKDGPVIASSITYAGFVGVLTGVRKDLSMSLNFRPNRIDNGKLWSDIKYVWYLIMVLLGRKPSISSTLRRFLLPQAEEKLFSWLPFIKPGEKTTLTYPEVVDQVGGEKPITSTSCYLCFSNGKETTTVEKDRISAVVRSNDDFIVVTNTDKPTPSTTNDTNATTTSEKPAPSTTDAALQELVEEAKDRQQCAFNNWTSMRLAKSKQLGLHTTTPEDLKTLAEMDEVIQMVQKYPTTNECTHFACVMDPTEGRVAWCRRWVEPITAKWIREHMSESW